MFLNDSSSEANPSKPKRLHTMYCGSSIVVSMGLCVLALGGWTGPSSQLHTAEWEQKKTCTHMWVFSKGREGLGLYCFQQMEVMGVGKGVCMSVCVLGACWSVFFLSLSTSELPLLHLAGSRTSAKMTEHTPLLFIHSLFTYLSLYLLSINLSAYLYAKNLPFFFSLSLCLLCLQIFSLAFFFFYMLFFVLNPL